MPWVVLANRGNGIRILDDLTRREGNFWKDFNRMAGKLGTLDLTWAHRTFRRISATSRSGPQGISERLNIRVQSACSLTRVAVLLSFVHPRNVAKLFPQSVPAYLRDSEAVPGENCIIVATTCKMVLEYDINADQKFLASLTGRLRYCISAGIITEISFDL